MDFETFKPPPELAPGHAPCAPQISPPSGLRKLIPGPAKKHAASLARTASVHQSDVARFNQTKGTKRELFAKLKADYEQRKSQFEMEVKRRNTEVDEFQTACRRIRRCNKSLCRALPAQRDAISETFRPLASYPSL